jgi:hypothetical protein
MALRIVERSDATDIRPDAPDELATLTPLDHVVGLVALAVMCGGIGCTIALIAALGQ